MATIQFDLSRQTQKGQIAQSVGSAITGEVSVTIDDGLSKLEAVEQLEKTIQYIREASIL